jgi:hypothetical protein
MELPYISLHLHMQTFQERNLINVLFVTDIVFCRTWYRVEVPKLYNPLTSLLLPPEQKNLWLGMKTVGQLKREKGIRSEPSTDSLYTVCIIVCETYPFVINLLGENVLQIPNQECSNCLTGQQRNWSSNKCRNM